jgi:hypothetical protein
LKILIERLIILLGGDDVPINSETLLIIDFINLKIKLTQSFKVAYRDMMYVRVFIEVSVHTYISICVCTVFLKKENHETKITSTITLQPNAHRQQQHTVVRIFFSAVGRL